MLRRIFPQQIDNTYRGYTLALWLLVPIVLMKLLMGGNSIINTRDVIETADKIPLGSYGAEAGAMIVFMFKSWGLNLVLLSLLGVLALIRYRAMVPLVYLLLLIENAGRKVFTAIEPIRVVSSGDGPSFALLINLGFIAALLVGFVLSIGSADDEGGNTEA